MLNTTKPTVPEFMEVVKFDCLMALGSKPKYHPLLQKKPWVLAKS